MPVVTPLVLHSFRAAAGTLNLASAALAASTDILIIVDAVFTNGAVNELTRLAVQRPRPFVYANPQGEGGNPAHYTSFYSGHTSFAAVSLMSLLLILAGRGVRRSWLYAIGSLWVVG